MWGSPGEAAVCGGDCDHVVDRQEDHQQVHFPRGLGEGAHLDQGDGEVVRGGVEPLDRGHHAAVVHCAQELRLEIYFSKKSSDWMERNGRENEEEVKEITWSVHPAAPCLVDLNNI